MYLCVLDSFKYFWFKYLWKHWKHNKANILICNSNNFCIYLTKWHVIRFTCKAIVFFLNPLLVTWFILILSFAENKVLASLNPNPWIFKKKYQFISITYHDMCPLPIPTYIRHSIFLLHGHSWRKPSNACYMGFYNCNHMTLGGILVRKHI